MIDRKGAVGISVFWGDKERDKATLPLTLLSLYLYIQGLFAGQMPNERIEDFVSVGGYMSNWNILYAVSICTL